MAGLTEDGLTIPTLEEIRARLEGNVIAAIPGIDLSGGPERSIIDQLATRLHEGWTTLEAIHQGSYPDRASGVMLNMIAALTGTKRRAATRSRVTATVTLAAGATLPIGAVAAVDGNPDVMFQASEATTNEDAVEADVDVAFVALAPGPLAAPAGTLTKIVTPHTGWNAITNATDAELGRVVADDDELRAQRVIELGSMGTGTLAAIKGRVARVDGVQQVEVYENARLATDAAGRPGKSIEVVLWDGDVPAADDDEIAQMIWDEKPAGIVAHGSSSGTATDEDGVEHTVAFTRATSLRVYVALEVELRTGASPAWQDDAKAAIVARAAEYRPGERCYATRLMCAAQDAVPSIYAIPSTTIGTAPAPVGAIVTPTYAQIVRVDLDDVDVTEAP